MTGISARPGASSSGPSGPSVSAPRSVGALSVSVGRMAEADAPAGRLRLRGLRQSGCLKALFPQRDPGSAVMVNTSGGLTGGDVLRIAGRAGPGAALTLTSQAAERIYRAAEGAARITTRLSAEAGGRIAWLPQETILFDGGALRRRIEVDLAADASLLMVEQVIFGRGARGETLARAALSDRVAVRRGGRILWRDGIELSGAVTARMARPGLGGGAGAVVSVLSVGPGAGDRLERVRAMLPPGAGASAPGPDILALRGLGADGWDLRRWLIPVLEYLGGAALPRVWRM